MPVAYLSAEIGLHSDLHTYSGGLGVLAGDHVKSAADASIDLVGVSLLYRQGYGRQHLDSTGNQTETYPEIDPSDHLEDTGVEMCSHSTEEHSTPTSGQRTFQAPVVVRSPCTSSTPVTTKTRPSTPNSVTACTAATT